MSGFGDIDSSHSAVLLPAVNRAEVQYSKGFLRCKPELWFPGFSAHWMPLLHSLNLQMELAHIEPLLDLSSSSSQVFLGSLDDEIVGLLVPGEAFEFIARVYVPAANLTAKHLVVEYFARRFLTSIAQSWSGNDEGVFRFEQEMSLDSDRFAGGLRLVFRVNGEELSLFIGIGKGLLEKFDKLWVSQVTQGAGTAPGSLPVKLILGGSYISPSEIGDVIAPGKDIPITFGGVHESFLFLHDEPWMKGELCTCDGALAFRVTNETDERFQGPTGTTQILFEAGTSEVTRIEMMLMGQSGAIHVLSEGSPNSIEIMIGGQKVADGEIVQHESQHFVRVSPND